MRTDGATRNADVRTEASDGVVYNLVGWTGYRQGLIVRNGFKELAGP